jgi:hypothetical protein
MAFVGITDQMCHEVRRKIRSMQNAEFDQLGDSPLESIQLAGDEPWLMEKAWQGRTDLINTLPQDWLRNPEGMVDFNIHCGEVTLGSVRVRSIKFPLPPMYGGNYPTVNITFTEENLPETFNGLKDYRTKRAEVEERWEKVQKAVRSFLENCKSLNEAVKLWPDLRVYIPQDYIARLDKKSERKAKEESNAAAILASIDTNEIQAAAVIARMSGAKL